MPALNQPVRNYPLRPINEPALFVVGEKIGRQAPHPNQHQGSAELQVKATGFGGMGNPQAMLAHQNSNLDALERRNPRDRSTSLTAVCPWSCCACIAGLMLSSADNAAYTAGR